MKSGLTALIVALTSSLSACASFDVELRSARIVYEPPLDPFDSQDKERASRVFLRVDSTTTFDFRTRGETIGYIVPCGSMRGHLGSPIGGAAYAFSYIVPGYDAPHPPGQVFTAEFLPGWPERLFNVTPSDEAPADGTWRVTLMDAAKVSGLCFYVLSGGTIFNAPTSHDIRIDGLLGASPAPPTEAKKK